ncbi:hypothetical protein ACIOKD_14350 [Streptomyces sp. NPDC087844]|uniref:hypothetical protein n=1 Tax=Streptomyces sp. NPDC087844 TaxID=3365805 RepID=UPI003804F98E
MADHFTGTSVPVPARRLIAAGFIRRLPGRTLTVRATQAGVTGTITAAGPVCHGRPMGLRDGQFVCAKCGAGVDPGATVRVAELHRLAREDYASSVDHRIQTQRDDAHLIASASEAVAAR